MSDPSMSSTQAQQPAIKKQYKNIIGLIAILLVLTVAVTTIRTNPANPAHAASPVASFTVNINNAAPGVVLSYVYNGANLPTSCLHPGDSLVGVADPNSKLTAVLYTNATCTGASQTATFQLGGANSINTWAI